MLYIVCNYYCAALFIEFIEFQENKRKKHQQEISSNSAKIHNKIFFIKIYMNNFIVNIQFRQKSLIILSFFVNLTVFYIEMDLF